VAAGAREYYRVVGRRRVQIAADRFSLLDEMIFVPIAAGDPFAWAEFLRFLADLLFQFGERFRLAEIDVAA
jgi:hypothetical protein